LRALEFHENYATHRGFLKNTQPFIKDSSVLRRPVESAAKSSDKFVKDSEKSEIEQAANWRITSSGWGGDRRSKSFAP